MNLKSIKESYSNLLKAFDSVGVKLNESQKADADAFIKGIESTVRHEKRLTEKKMEREYRHVFESIMKNMQRNSELASAIQDKVTKINESRKLASHVDNFLDLYVESVLPRKTIIDYDRMTKLERLHESLKDTLLVNEDSVDERIKKIEESYKLKLSKCETEVAKARVKLNESEKKVKNLKHKLLKEDEEDSNKKEKEVVSDPVSQSEDIEETEKKVCNDCDSADVVTEEVDDQLKRDIEKILESDDTEVKEDDMLKNRPHNAHKDELTEAEDVEEDDMLKNRVHNAHVSVDEEDELEEEDFETMEIVRETADGDVELDESDIIDSNLMKLWCRQSIEVR